MIVQPDFLEHWKTRRLIEITKDESSPLAVIRLWAHCQHCRRSVFPDMTPVQLASICRWGSRKPACHAALIKAGFVEKWSPKGFAAHQWSEHNAQLLQKWHAGQKGGRPPATEKPNEDGPSGKPTGNRPTTGTKPDEIDEVDERREEKSDRPDEADGHSPEAAQGKLVFIGPTAVSNDWQGKPLSTKVCEILGREEAVKDCWLKRINGAPEDLEEIVDAMREEIQRGKVIKNRGAYAESLWKLKLKAYKQSSATGL